MQNELLQRDKRAINFTKVTNNKLIINYLFHDCSTIARCFLRLSSLLFFILLRFIALTQQSFAKTRLITIMHILNNRIREPCRTLFCMLNACDTHCDISYWDNNATHETTHHTKLQFIRYSKIVQPNSRFNLSMVSLLLANNTGLYFRTILLSRIIIQVNKYSRIAIFKNN